ncbi:cyclic nucleotide-binding domain-containing protein [Pseudomonas viridiflava]|uniref:Cyclic nucleotide-binding protein n=1 Tax=Pseudomonas viridiflava TaxID=33069 RepID=A0A3M5NYK0_PSEVI|nr:cyclic nucleotide-binding domain-containing protein [Pseudomonas viridiflava]MBA1230163.1 cyclic nucleotide-binding domain-containing protein [Pseudomonas viridiflava]RMT77047.1 Cyclic nucleotide-binding protein [Pseudomonas viridiflava]
MTNGTLWRSRLLSDYWFSHLPAGLQDSLLDAAFQIRKTPGKALFKKGDPACGLYVLVEGSVRVGPAADQRLVPRLEPVCLPYWFAEVSLFDGLPRRLDVVSQEQTIFLHVPQRVLMELLNQHPHYWHAFAALLSHKLGLPIPRPEEMARLPARHWVAWRLLMLSEGYGRLSHARRLITLDEIRPRSDISEAVLLEVLQDFNQRKIVRLGEGQLEVFEVEKLRRVANYSKASAVC